MSVVLPMESNPETMNKYLQKLGVPEKWRMVDVIGLEGEALSWVSRPVLAVILLFPLSEAYEEHRCQQEKEMLEKGLQPPSDVIHLKQVLSNVCGTVALVHSIANNTHNIELQDGLLKKYLNEANGLDAAARGALLESTTTILNAYKEVVHADVEEEGHVNNHFVTFVHKGGILYELDGRKSFPVSHGKTTADSLLEDAGKVCMEFIAREPDNICFNVVALVQSD